MAIGIWGNTFQVYSVLAGIYSWVRIGMCMSGYGNTTHLHPVILIMYGEIINVCWTCENVHDQTLFLKCLAEICSRKIGLNYMSKFYLLVVF